MHKTTLAAAYIAAALAAFIHSGQLAAPAPSTTYPLAGVVTTVDRAADLVTFRTGSGHLYSLTGCDDWLPGDVIACTMDDNGTPQDVTDDTITQYRYCGLVTFVSDIWPTEYMHLFHATGFTGTPKDCDEGELACHCTCQAHPLCSSGRATGSSCGSWTSTCRFSR